MAKSVGKPKILIEQEQLDEVEKLAASGCTKKEIAHSLGISYSTFFVKEQEYPELLESFEVGRSKGTATASRVLMELVEEKHFPAVRFFLVNRAEDRWSDNPGDKKGNSGEEMEALGQRMRLAFESARIIEGVVVPDE